MQKIISFENKNEIEQFSNYDDEKFALARCCFLSTAPNSHHLIISEDVLKRDAHTLLGNMLVAKMEFGDFRGHEKGEIPLGYFVPDQQIEFEEVWENNEKVVKAYAYAVLSKQYAKEAYEAFLAHNYRKTSIEMKVDTDIEDEDKVISFDAYGLTVLGMDISPSCKEADITLVRFEAEQFFNSNDTLVKLKTFAEKRIKQMETKKYYKIDKNKDAMSYEKWEDVDKIALRDKIVNAQNAEELVKNVYLKVEEDWEKAPSETLKYPVMEIEKDKVVYNRYGLAAALGRAKQNNEKDVIKKVKEIYKDLDLEDRKEDMAHMKDKKLDEIEGRKAWAEVIRLIQEHEGKSAYVDSIEDDHIIYTKGGVRYHVDADVDVDDDDKEVKVEIKWDTLRKDADQRMEEIDLDAMRDKMHHMEKEIEERDHIIMDKDKELEELRSFKKSMEEKEKAMEVSAVMEEVKGCMCSDEFKKFSEEGMQCDYTALDGWKNKVKAFSFDKSKNKSKQTTEHLWMAAPTSNVSQKTNSIWDKI